MNMEEKGLFLGIIIIVVFIVISFNAGKIIGGIKTVKTIEEKYNIVIDDITIKL